jgi:hypothetical protein
LACAYNHTLYIPRLGSDLGLKQSLKLNWTLVGLDKFNWYPVIKVVILDCFVCMITWTSLGGFMIGVLDSLSSSIAHWSVYTYYKYSCHQYRSIYKSLPFILLILKIIHWLLTVVVWGIKFHVKNVTVKKNLESTICIQFSQRLFSEPLEHRYTSEAEDCWAIHHIFISVVARTTLMAWMSKGWEVGYKSHEILVN